MVITHFVQVRLGERYEKRNNARVFLVAVSMFVNMKGNKSKINQQLNSCFFIIIFRKYLTS